MEKTRQEGVAGLDASLKHKQGGISAVGQSAEAIDRGMTFKLNDAIKRDFLEGNIKTHMMMAEDDMYRGGRTYNQNSKKWKSGFIGLWAEENPDRLKGYNIEFFQKEAGAYRIRLQDNSVKGRTVDVGHITAVVSGDTATISSKIADEYKGNKLSYALYSEMAERLRAMGIRRVDGQIVNKDGVPIRVRERIIGDTRDYFSGKPIDQIEGAIRIREKQAQFGNMAGVDVYNRLDPNARYMMAEGNDWSKSIADAQRDKPETAMVKAQYKIGGGAIPIAIEHAGDILHRTYERININNGSFGYETVKYKVNLVLKRISDLLLNKDEFRREVVSNFANDKKSTGTSEQHLAEVKRLLKEFGDAHAELPANNELQRRVKALNVALGNLDFNSAHRELKFLNTKLINENTWTDFAKEGMSESKPNTMRQMPEEGGRTYTAKQMDREFIGRIAEESPELTKGLKLFYGKVPQGMGTGGLTLRDKKGDVVGNIKFERFGEDVSILKSDVYTGHQGKGYGNLIYSELIERLRSEGVKTVDGWITDKEGRPQKIRRKVIDTQNEKVKGGERTRVFAENGGGRDVISYLKPQARYMMAEGDALIQNGFEKSELNKQLIASGHIVLGFDERELAGKAVVINNPDTMMTGELKTKEGKTLVEGEGGLNFVSKFADIWAKSKQSAAETTAKLLIKAQNENNGVAYLGLTRGDLTKPLTSHTGAKAGMSILEYFVEQGYISLEEFRNALKDSGKKYGIDFNATQSGKAIHAEIANKFFGVSDSSFKDRGNFVTDVITHLAEKGESGHTNIAKIREALGSERLGRKIDFAAKGIKEAIGLMISDKRANVDPSHIYAYIEVTGKISVEKTENGHKSYPWHIVQRDSEGNKIRPRMLLPDKTNYITDVMLDANKEVVPRSYQVTTKKGKLQTKSGADKLGSNQVGEAYGYVKPANDIPEGKERLKWQPAESEKAPVNWVKESFDKEGYNAEIIWMTPERFLNLAAPLGERANSIGARERIEELKKTLQRKGGDMDMPYFSMKRNKNGELQVRSHEGRHRAIALKELYGDKKIPVVLTMDEIMKLENSGEFDFSEEGRIYGLKPEAERKKGTVSKEFKSLENTPFLNEQGTGKFQPAEGWRDWQSERTSVGSVIKNTAGYVIMVQKGKFKVYNPYKAMIGIYDNEEQAKRRVQKDEPKR
jgi:hypothetical protein